LHADTFVADNARENNPFPQGVGTINLEPQQWPGGHASQNKLDDAPVTAENVPGGHADAAIMDELGQKNPLGQSKHILAPSKFDHVPGRHGDGIDVPGPQKNPFGQMMQSEE
jgi:hypothetical protein